MKSKYIAILIAVFMSASLFSQTNLNNYKYVIVPNKFDFLKEKDQYQLNSLTKFLFEKYGFEALMEGEKYPEDLIRNRCLALKSNLIKDSGMFKTKLAVELIDCNDAVIYTSEMGESRDKEFKKAYNEALRDAFNSIEAIAYTYEPSAKIATSASPETQVTNNTVAAEIQQLKEEIQNLKKDKEIVIEVTEPNETTVPPVPNNEPQIKELKNTEVAVKEMATGVLYAQAIENGFQLVDSSPKVIYKIRKTGIADVFMVENKNATLYKKGENWILEYYENNVLKQEVLTIKF